MNKRLQSQKNMEHYTLHETHSEQPSENCKLLARLYLI